MKNLFSLPALLLALLLLTGSGASAQGLINVRIWGGPSWNVGGGFASVGSNKEGAMQPEAGVGPRSERDAHDVVEKCPE